MSAVGLEGHACFAFNAHPVWEIPLLLFEMLKVSCEGVGKNRWEVLLEASEVRHTKHNHRKLVNLFTQTTALSNSVKLRHAMWGHPRRAGHGGEV